MKKLLKWSGISVAVAAGVVLTIQCVAAVRKRVDRGLEHMERVTQDARLAMEKTTEALEHTEDAVREIRRTVS